MSHALHKARILFQQSRFDQALTAANEALAGDAEDIEAISIIAECHLQLKKF